MIDDKKIRCLRQALAAWPKAELGHFPTPLEPLQRLHGSHNENRLWIKRDDCSGLGLGGNKVRQLEYYMGDAMARQSDCVLSTGAVQSNYMRTLAAAAAKLGLECHIQLESRVSDPDEDYLKSGNVLLDKMFGATIHHYAEGEDESGADAAIEALAAKLQESGKKPYIVPLAPVEQPKGALGYVDSAIELAEQFRDLNMVPDAIVVGSGSSLTHAGILTGLRALGLTMPVIGACVRRSSEVQQPRVLETCRKVVRMLGDQIHVSSEDIELSDVALAPGYGQASQKVLDAIAGMARQEGILVDPVYSGKMVSTTVQLLEQGRFKDCRNVLMIHTGGTPALFAYRDLLSNI